MYEFTASILQCIREKHNRIRIIDAVHLRPKKIGERKYSEEVLYIIYWDLETETKKLATFRKPVCDIYFVKPEFREGFKRQRSFLPEFKCEKVPVEYRKRRSRIIEEIKKHDPNSKIIRMIQTAYNMGNWSALNEVHKWRYCMQSNYNLVDHAIMMSILEFNQQSPHRETVPLTKVYLDIESDVLYRYKNKFDYSVMPWDMILAGEAPINAVTVIFNHKPDSLEKEYNVYTYLLWNPERYDAQQEFKDNLPDFIQHCHESFDERFHKAKYHVEFFDTELGLIAQLFKTLHKYKSDIGLIWNMNYEMPQFDMRIRVNGYKPEQFFTHPDFKAGMLYEYVHREPDMSDGKAKDITANKTIYLNNTGYTKWMDQMVNYAAFRKGGHDYGGNDLENISQIELGAGKQKFKDPNTHITNAAVREYFLFAKYSILDVWNQVGIDEKTQDTDKVYGLSMDSAMSMNNVHKTTQLLINNITKNLFQYDERIGGEAPKFVIGNNLNS